MTIAIPDYLAVGHVTKDVTADGYKVGGTVSFSACLAQAMECHAAVLTSVTSDFDLAALFPDADILNVPAEQMTVFENIYTPQGRRQRVLGVAAPLMAADVPDPWQEATIVHLGPLVQEVDPDMLHLFPNSLVGLTPQGWLRDWNDEGYVAPCEWPDAASILPRADAVIVGLEDFIDEAMLQQFREHCRLLVVTNGDQGCTVYRGETAITVPALPADEVDPTGAGDIFSTAFLIRLHRNHGDAVEAAHFANRVAAASVSVLDLADKVTAWQDG